MSNRTPAYKGFTLIELLVVIAIIGILSAVVLSALNQARSKGNDAAIKSSLDNARAQAELFYDSNGNNYSITAGGTTDLCSATGMVSGVKGLYSFAQSAADAYGGLTVNNALGTAGSASNVTCHATTGSAGGWALQAPLKSAGGFYCVDSTGKTATSTTTLLGTGSDVTC